MNRNRKKETRAGLTLIELLLVLAILVILASIVTLSVVNMSRTGRARAAQLQISAIESALQAHYIDMGSFPESLSALRDPPNDPSAAARWSGPYLDKDLGLDPWGNEYRYQGGGDTYSIRSLGPDRVEGTDDDVYAVYPN